MEGIGNGDALRDRGDPAERADWEDGACRARFAAFGTVVDLVAYGSKDAMEAAIAEARRSCRAYEALFSRKSPGSDIGRLNAAKGQPVSIDPRTAEVLLAAKRYCAASEGAFDVTVGPLVACWDLKAGLVPSPSRLAEAARHVGWQGLGVQRRADGSWAARLADPQASVDLGGIAKGWIADAVGAALMQSGATGALVNLGGNVLACGSKPDGLPWRIGIREPKPLREQPGCVKTIELAQGSVVTSGVYERCFVRNGTRYHHVLDPRTGQPAQTPWAGVSVVANRSIIAEGFSTTLLALGLERSRTLAAKHPEIAQAYFVRWDGTWELLRPAP